MSWPLCMWGACLKSDGAAASGLGSTVPSHFGGEYSLVFSFRPRAGEWGADVVGVQVKLEQRGNRRACLL
jgi:hypothetical protein